MKYWRGYLTAAIFVAMSVVLQKFAQRYTVLVDMVYPYVTRSIQSFLTAWTAGVAGCVWQIALLLLVVLVLASLVLVVVFRRNLVQWLGWAAAAVSIVFFLYTGIYGLNYYSGPIQDDLRMDMVDYTQTELETATVFYRDMANSLATQMQRDENDSLVYSDFETLAAQTGDGFRTLTVERSFSILGGDYTPVKKLGWSGMYTAMGITGFTSFLTGEACVNPQIPGVCLPFTMAQEMAHRLCIAREDEADFAAFLTCSANESLEYQYSAYFMAYRYCYNALSAVDENAAQAIAVACNAQLSQDLAEYSEFFASHKDPQAARVGDAVNDAYLMANGTEEGIASYGAVCDYLVNWYIDEYTEPEEVETKFDPYDESQVDLSGIVNAKPQESTPQETESEE